MKQNKFGIKTFFIFHRNISSSGSETRKKNKEKKKRKKGRTRRKRKIRRLNDAVSSSKGEEGEREGGSAVWQNECSIHSVQYCSVDTRESREEYVTVQYSTVQCGTVQLSIVQYSTIQYSTVQYNTAQHSTVQYSTI